MRGTVLGASLLLLSTSPALGAPGEASVTRLLEGRLPPAYADRAPELAQVILECSSAHDLDPLLVLGVITVESGFRPRAKSPVGALGLMQVMPATGRAWAARAGVRWRGVETLYDPVENVRIGTLYLSWLEDRFRGRMGYALASYCHGPGRIRGYLRAGQVPARRMRYARKVIRAKRWVVRWLADIERRASAPEA